MGCGPDQGVTVTLDGNDVTGVSLSGSWTPRLNRPAQAQITLPMESASVGDCGSRLKIVLGGDDIVFHGMVMNTETDTDKDGGTTVFNAMDAMELWQSRPVRADDADFSKPVGSGAFDGSDLIATYDDAPSIMERVLINTVTNPDGPNGGVPPTDAEGEIFLDVANYGTGGASMAGAPVDWPMTIMDFFSLLVSTGQLDAVIEYTDPGGGVMGTVGLYDGNFGTDLSGSISFDYGQGARTAQAIRWNRDMSGMCNKYWIFTGPRVETAADPAGEQHWCFNVQGDDSGLPGFNASSPYIDVINRRLASQSQYGVRMKIDIFDGYDDTCIQGFATGRELYRWQWIIYSYLAAIPREIVHVIPTDDTYLGCFGIGDIVGVSAVSDVKGGFSGAQRIYEYTVSWEGSPSVLTISELQTSADAEL